MTTYIPRKTNPTVLFSFLLFLLFAHLLPAQQPNIGGAYNPQDKVLWLKAEDIIPVDTDRVGLWPDASGNNHNAISTDNAHRPEYIPQSNLFNNLPAVRFNAGVDAQMLEIADHQDLDGMQKLTLITVMRNSDPPMQGSSQGVIGKLAADGNLTSWRFHLTQSATSRQMSFRINTSGAQTHYYNHYNEAMIFSSVFSGQENFRANHANARLYNKQNFWDPNVNRNPGTSLVIGNTHTQGSGWLKGEIAEIIVLRDALNQAQRLLVENILAHKYQINLKPTSPTRYFLQNFNSPYDNDIIGIGGFLAGDDFGYHKHSASLGGGGALYLSEVANSFDENNEFVFAAHNGASHTTTQNDLPTDIDLSHRWERVWRIERSILPGTGNGTSVRIGFEFEGTGMSPDPEGLYVLLYRSGTSGIFTRMPISAGPSGTKVSFSVPENLFNTGYYTIAKSSLQIKKWASVKNGPWTDPATWGLSVGYPGANALEDRADNIEINNNHIITVSENDYIHGDLWIKSGASLNINTTRGHAFNTIRGGGRIIITGNYFPEGDASNFHKSGGGTVVYSGSGDFDFTTTRLFNNMEINLDGISDQITLLANLTLQGNLSINRGVLQINDENTMFARQLNIAGDISIHNQGKLLTGEANSRHKLTIGGNFSNEGYASFCNLIGPSYLEAPANGMVDVVFNNLSDNQTITANGETRFYRIEIAKGVTDSLYIRSSNANRFFLLGQNNINQTTGNWAPNLPNENALGLLSGIVVLEHNIHIPVLKSFEGYGGDYLIDQDAQIVLSGGILETNDDITSIAIYGSLVVLEGLLNVQATDGVVLRNTGTFQIDNGTAIMRMFRTSVATGLHRGAYIQTGGSVTVTDPDNRGNLNYYRFTLPYPTNTFIMSDGELIVSRPRETTQISPNGGILIASDPEYYNVTGGTVTAIIDNHRSFIINSAAPFYNLNLIKSTHWAEKVFYIEAYAGGQNDPGTSIPPPPVEAHPLRVINQLTLHSDTYAASLDLNGYAAVVDGNVTIQQGAQLLGANSNLTFSGAGNSTLVIQDPSDIFNVGVLKLDKSNTSDELILLRTNVTDNSEIFHINDSLVVAQGTINYGTYQLSLKGHLSLSGIIGKDPAQGKLLLNGNALQKIIVPSAEAISSIAHLELDNANGFELSNNSIQSIGQLSLNAGVLNLGTYGISLEGSINGSNFDETKMIATAGGHSNHGLRRKITQNGSMLFPVGTTAADNPRYTPLLATFDAVSTPVYVQLNPVDQELTTLAGLDLNEALSYYWRMRHSETTNYPNITSYVFTYHTSDLPSPITADFVPGKVVNLERRPELTGNYNSDNQTLTFSTGSPFALEAGEYTAAREYKFTGTVKVFYSKAGTDFNNPSPWNDFSTWTEDPSHAGPNVSDLPAAGDLVQIGFSGTDPHAVEISSSVSVAGVSFLNNQDQLPRLIVDDANINVNLGIVSGEGSLALQLGVEAATLEGDLEDFISSSRSEFVYTTSTTDNYSLLSNLLVYPNLRIEGPSTMMFPESEVNVNGDLTITNSATVTLHNGSNGNLSVMGSLHLGTTSLPGKFLLPASGTSRTLHIMGDLLLNGNASTRLGVISSNDNIIHTLRIDGNIIHNAGEIRLFEDLGSPRVTLELSGSFNASYARLNGLELASLFRIVMNKGNSPNVTFSFLSNFNLNDIADGVVKPIQLQNGTLDLAADGIDVRLTSGGSDFLIPATAGLLLRANTIARANATNVGITLNGLLRMEDNSHLISFTGDNGSRTYIQYGGSGNASIEIFDNANLEIATQLRGIIGNDNGVLKYLQEGGNVTIGRHPVTLHNAYGFFEIHNPGSSFRFTEGKITVVRGHVNEPGNHKPSVYLVPADGGFVTNEATFQIGNASTPNNYTLDVYSDAALPNVILFNHNADILSNNFIVEGDLTLYPAKTLDAGNANLYLHGNLINNGILDLSNAPVYFRGDMQRIEGASSTTFSDLFIQPLQEVILNRDILVEGSLYIARGALNDSGFSIYAFQDVVNNAIHLSSENTGGLKFSGTSASQHVSGTGKFGRFVLENTNNVILDSPLTISDALIINYGSLNIQSHLLTLEVNCQVISPNGFDSQRMIQTSGDISAAGVKRYIQGINNYTYPLGVSGKYTPATINVSNNPSTAEITISPINQKHPNIDSPGNLNYFWTLTSQGLTDFTGDLNFFYHGNDVDPVESEYIAAKLSGETWQHFTTDEVNENTNQISFLVNTGEISGHYTAGSDIPLKVLKFRSISAGNWADKNNWENITEGYSSTDVPENGPSGQIIEIAPDNVIYTGSDRKIAFRTILNGTLHVQTASPNHYIGEVSGLGRIVSERSTIPVGNYSAFAENGTFEYSGTSDYSIDPLRYPATGIKNMVFSGEGRRTLPAGDLIINGDFEVQDNAEVAFNDDNTHLVLKGNIIKSETSAVNTGFADAVISFEGSQMQYIQGNFSGSSKLKGIDVKNAYGVSIDGIVELQNMLKLSNGNINTSAAGTLRLLSNASVNGATSNRFINGPLQKLGNAPFVFPLGHNGRMGRISFVPQTENPWSAETLIEGRYFVATPPNFEEGDNNPLAGVSQSEYWSLKSITPNKSGDIMGQVRLYIEDADFSGILFEDQILVAWYDQPEALWRSHGGFYDEGNPGFIQSDLINLVETNGLFSFGANETGYASNPLPIELLSFSARPENNQVLLQWSTGSEINNNYFTLERSSNGLHYEIVGYISGAGNSNILLHYQYSDEQPLSGTSYYRLKQTDYDGTFQYSSIIVVQMTQELETTMLVYPNPVNNGILNIRLQQPNPEDKLELTITDVYGRMVHSESLISDYNGFVEYTVNDLQNNMQGVYFVIIQNQRIRLSERIVIN